MRLWPLAALIVAHYVFVQATYSAEMAMFPRFISRLASTLVVLIVFLVWWLRNRNYRWSDRLLAIAMLAAGIATADLAGDPTINIVNLMLDAVPLTFALGIALLYVVRSRPVAVHRLGFAAIIVAVFGLASLLRWDGLDGRQQGRYTWRWIPSAEQKFLASRRESAAKPEIAPAREIALQPGDWAGFRGGEKEGIALSGPLGDWKSSPPKLVWKHRVGPAWSSISIIDGMAVTQEQRGDEECVVAYDMLTGKELWAHGDKVRFDEPLSGAGPRGTPAFCDGRIYTSGGRGRLNGLDASNGAVVWTKDLIAEAKGNVPNFGSSSSPVVVDHLIIAFAGGEGDQGLFALDATTGKEVWRTKAGTETFSSPQLVTLQGVRQILMHDNSGLFAVSIDDGKRLWLHPSESAGAVPMLQHHVLADGDIVTGWSDGIARFAVDKSGDSWTVTEKWKTNRLKPGFNEYVVHEDHIYGLDDGIFCCLELSTGKRLWKKGRYGAGQMLLLPEQSRIVVLGETGEVILVATNPKELDEIAKFPAIEGKTWQHPVLAHGKLFVRNAEEIACFEIAAQR